MRLLRTYVVLLFFSISCGNNSTPIVASKKEMNVEEYGIHLLIKKCNGVTYKDNWKISDYFYDGTNIHYQTGNGHDYDKRTYSNIKWSFARPYFSFIKWGKLSRVDIVVPCHLKHVFNSDGKDIVNEGEPDGIQLYILPEDEKEFKETLLKLINK